MVPAIAISARLPARFARLPVPIKPSVAATRSSASTAWNPSTAQYRTRHIPYAITPVKSAGAGPQCPAQGGCRLVRVGGVANRAHDDDSLGAGGGDLAGVGGVDAPDREPGNRRRPRSVLDQPQSGGLAALLRGRLPDRPDA